MCDPTPLDRAALALFGLDVPTLCDAIASALALVTDCEAVRGLHQTWTVGVWAPFAGVRIPVYLTVQAEPVEFEHVVDALVARATDRFILTAPTRDHFGSNCEDALRRKDAHFLALADEFVLDADGKVQPQRPIIEILEPLRAAVQPVSKDVPRRWSGRPLTSSEAAKALDYPSGDTLLKAVRADRIQSGSPLYVLRQRGPGRTRGGKFYEDAVAHVAGLLGVAHEEYEAGVAERIEQARAAKADVAPPDPAKAERLIKQVLTRQERESR